MPDTRRAGGPGRCATFVDNQGLTERCGQYGAFEAKRSFSLVPAPCPARNEPCHFLRSTIVVNGVAHEGRRIYKESRTLREREEVHPIEQRVVSALEAQLSDPRNVTLPPIAQSGSTWRKRPPESAQRLSGGPGSRGARDRSRCGRHCARNAER
jgi:hypothetical protein